MHHHIDSILKNMELSELLHHFLPIILDAPDLKNLYDKAAVIYDIIKKNPEFVSNLLYSNVLFVEVLSF